MCGVFSGAVEEVECAFDFCALRGGEAVAAESDDVQPCDTVDIRCENVGRHVFSKARKPLTDGVVADADELMKNTAAPDEYALADMNVAGEQDVVGEDDVVAEMDVVREVRPGHEEAAIADDRLAALGGAAMNGDVFANAVAVADDDTAFHLGLKSKILRFSTDDRAVADGVVFSHQDVTTDDRVGGNCASFADDSGSLDDGVRPDAHTRVKLGLRMDDGGGMEHGIANDR